MNRTAASLLALVVVASGCSRAPETASTESIAPVPLAQLPAIDAGRILEHTRTLSSDAFEGRAPGTAGEERTVQYLTEQFKALGL